MVLRRCSVSQPFIHTSESIPKPGTISGLCRSNLPPIENSATISSDAVSPVIISKFIGSSVFDSLISLLPQLTNIGKAITETTNIVACLFIMHISFRFCWFKFVRKCLVIQVIGYLDNKRLIPDNFQNQPFITRLFIRFGR